MADDARLDLARPHHVHLVGVGGAGMSGLATLLAAGGHTVTGSDLVDSATLTGLRAAGLDVWVGHRPEGAARAQHVAVSTAVPADDPEVVAAAAAGVPVHSRAELLAALAALRRVLAVSGTHGKTTTTAMVALVLEDAGWQPSFLVGGVLPTLGGGARWGAGEWFVVEADESDGTFLALGAEAVVVTNVEPDHLDQWGSGEAQHAAFRQFVMSARGPRVVCLDDPGSAALAAITPTVTYGTAAAADVRLVSHRADPPGTRSLLEIHSGADGLEAVEIRLGVPGLHNARNAAAAVAVTRAIGVPLDAAVRALGRFEGVSRRFELRGEAGGVVFVDDYAHLPTEVAATLEAARGGPWSRIVCVFQPHRVSRTAELGPSFGPVFEGADVVVVTDVYRAGEPARPGVTGALVADAVRDADPTRPVRYEPERDRLVDTVLAELRPGDLCLTLGAGDVTTLPAELLARLEAA